MQAEVGHDQALSGNAHRRTPCGCPGIMLPNGLAVDAGAVVDTLPSQPRNRKSYSWSCSCSSVNPFSITLGATTINVERPLHGRARAAQRAVKGSLRGRA